MEELLTKLTDMRGISGYEYRINEKIKELFLPYADEVKITNLGSVVAFKKGRTSKMKIMLEAHCDEIGLMISKISDDGFLSFVNVGGVDSRILPAAEVTIHGKKDIKGVVGAKPPHILTDNERKNGIKITDMSIDTGLDYQEVTKLISVGDSVSLSQSVGRLKNDNFSAKTLDDRAGVAAIIEVFKRIGQIDADLYALISVQEEVGLRGAKTGAFEINPDVAIAIDVCHAVTFDNSKNAFEAGEGAVITIGPNIHQRLADKLFEIARKYDIKTKTDVDSGHTGTDAWEIQVTRCGIPTGLISIPLKYMHTSVEAVNLKDLDATVSLLERLLKESDDFTEDWLCY